MNFNILSLGFTTLATVTGVSLAINWTVIASVISVSLALMVALIKIFGYKSKISDENLRSSPYLIALEADIKDKEQRLAGVKDLINAQNTEVEILKSKTSNSEKTLEDLKQDNRDLVQRLDDLLKQFMEYMEG